MVLRAPIVACTEMGVPKTHADFVISRLRNDFFISYHSNESEYYSFGALLLLSQRVLLNFITDSVYHKQRNVRAFSVGEMMQCRDLSVFFSGCPNQEL
jgi:hypothetical protein